MIDCTALGRTHDPADTVGARHLWRVDGHDLTHLRHTATMCAIDLRTSMDPISGGFIALLIARAQKWGVDGVEGTVERLVATIRGRLRHDQDASAALVSIERDPSDSANIEILGAAIERCANDDLAFRQSLAQEVSEIAKVRPTFVTEVRGGHVGKIVNIEHAGDVTF